MRIFFVLVFLCFSHLSFSADYQWFSQFGDYSATASSPFSACSTALSKHNAANPLAGYSLVSVSKYSNPAYFTCRFADKNGYSGDSYVFYASRSGDSCPQESTYNPDTGECDSDSSCASKKDQVSPFFDKYDSYDDYKPSCRLNVDGCSLNICDTASSECGTNGKTGEFACWGVGAFTGEPASENEGTASSDQPPMPEPTVTDSNQSCSSPVSSGSTTTQNCTTQSESNENTRSGCTVSSSGGSTVLSCSGPKPKPTSDTKVRDDQITEETQPDGSKTKTTESTTTRTQCVQGTCTTTTTTTTTTESYGPDGTKTGESSSCAGDRCDNPATDKDESEEDEEEPAERTVNGESCSATLACEGDAIDCAILRQQKEMRCSLDWDTQKSDVLAEASKPEYELEEAEIDAAALFNGPSASRWLSAGCPPDASVYLASIGRSVTFSWSAVCQYASVFGYLFVFSASLFFATYVGRAFGGS